MSTNATSHSLDLLSADFKKPAGILASVSLVWRTVSESLDALYQYQRLTARGIAPDVAARKVFDDNFAK